MPAAWRAGPSREAMNASCSARDSHTSDTTKTWRLQDVDRVPGPVPLTSWHSS